MYIDPVLLSIADFFQSPYITLVAVILNIALAVVILNRNSRSELNRIYAMAAFTIAVWGAAEFMERSSETTTQAFLWERVSSFGYIFAPLLQCWFAMHFVGIASLSRKILVGFFGFFSVILFVLVWTTHFIVGGVNKFDWGYGGRVMELYPFLVMLLFIETGLVLFLYLKTIITAKDKSRKNQAILLFIGGLLPLTLGFYTDAILPMRGHSNSMMELATLTTTINFLFVAFAIVRYGFLGIGIEIAAPFVLATLANPVFIIDENARIVYVNRAAQDLAVAEENVLLSKNIAEYLPELPPRALSTYFNQENIFKDSGGKTIPVRVLAQRVADLTSGIRGNVVMLQDLTEIKKLQETQARTRAETEATRHGAELIQSVAEGIFSTNKEGRIILWNPAMTKLTGISSQEVLGKSISEGLHIIDKSRRDVDIHKNFLTKVLNDKKPVSISFVDGYFLFNKEKERVAIELTGAPLYHTDGDLFGVVVVVSDETREFKADRVKSEFVSIASHQLRTPLSTIKWFTEMLLHGDVGEMNQPQRAFMEDVMSSVDRVIDIVNMLLNVSRIEQETLAVIPELTDFVKLIKMIVEESKIDMERKEITYSVEVKENFSLISLDPRLMRFVIENLVQNAIRYSFRGGHITITIEKDGEYVKVGVADKGCGIPDEDKNRIFQKFFRASNAQTLVQDGTGLGLFIAKAAIELSGGNISFKSEQNKGTTFFFTLPLAGSKPRDGFKQLS